MEQNTTTAIFNLMQNVVDKLDAISQDLEGKGDNELKDILAENSNELKLRIKKVIENQSGLAQAIQSSEEKIIQSF